MAQNLKQITKTFKVGEAVLTNRNGIFLERAGATYHSPLRPSEVEVGKPVVFKYKEPSEKAEATELYAIRGRPTIVP